MGQLHILDYHGERPHAVDLPAPFGRRDLERGARGADDRQHRRRRRPGGGGGHRLERRGGLRPARHRPARVPLGDRARQLPADRRAAGRFIRTFGVVDTPADGAGGVTGAIAVTGWALDDTTVQAVEVWRDAVSGEPAGPLFMGTATFVAGARPISRRRTRGTPTRTGRGGATCCSPTCFPAGGNGTYSCTCGRSTGRAARPSSARGPSPARTPRRRSRSGRSTLRGRGRRSKGSGYVVFGWALTPQTGTIPTDGSTIWVYVDGTPRGHPVYNQYRSDVGTFLPGVREHERRGGVLRARHDLARERDPHDRVVGDRQPRAGGTASAAATSGSRTESRVPFLGGATGRGGPRRVWRWRPRLRSQRRRRAGRGRQRQPGEFTEAALDTALAGGGIRSLRRAGRHPRDHGEDADHHHHRGRDRSADHPRRRRDRAPSRRPTSSRPSRSPSET